MKKQWFLYFLKIFFFDLQFLTILWLVIHCRPHSYLASYDEGSVYVLLPRKICFSIFDGVLQTSKLLYFFYCFYYYCSLLLLLPNANYDAFHCIKFFCFFFKTLKPIKYRKIHLYQLTIMIHHHAFMLHEKFIIPFLHVPWSFMRDF